MPRVKGPWFPSYNHQEGSSKRVMVWRPGTQSTRQQKRNLRGRIRHILHDEDPAIVGPAQRAFVSVCRDPDPEFSALHLFATAQDMHEDTGESWATCLTYLLDKFDEQAATETPAGLLLARGDHEDTGQAPSNGGASIGQILRSAIARTFRKGHAADPKTNVD